MFDETLFPFSKMFTSPQDPTTLEFVSDDDDSSLSVGPRAMTVGTQLLGGMDAALGAPGVACTPSSALHARAGLTSSHAPGTSATGAMAASVHVPGSSAADPLARTSTSMSLPGAAAPMDSLS